MRRVRRHVREPEAPKLVVARERMEARVVLAEHFQEPQADRLRVDVQAIPGRYGAGVGDGARERACVSEHPGLEASLQLP